MSRYQGGAGWLLARLDGRPQRRVPPQRRPVTGAVLFGDPFKTQAVGKLASSKVKEYCASGDPVCENGFNVMAHLSYGSDAKEAARFLIEAAGLSTSS